MQIVKWDQQYAKFKEHAGMPKKGSPLYSWKDTQLAIRPGGLNATRIVKEIENNKGGTVWSDMRDMIKRCVAIKMCHMQSIKWDHQYAKFEEQVGKPNKGSPLYNWKQGQLATLDAMIEKEIAEFGDTVWSIRRDMRKRCIATK
jgi:hypothetical protein